MKKALAVILAVLMLMSTMSIASFAAVNPGNEVAPCYNNTNSARVTLGINSSGLATVSLSCIGKSGVTTKIVAETKLERKVGFLWIDVDNAEWTDTVNGYRMSKSHTFQLTKEGTYRAKTTYTVSGSGGSNDVITVTSQDVY